eukprot:s530_g28.t1
MLYLLLQPTARGPGSGPDDRGPRQDFLAQTKATPPPALAQPERQTSQMADCVKGVLSRINEALTKLDRSSQETRGCELPTFLEGAAVPFQERRSGEAFTEPLMSHRGVRPECKSPALDDFQHQVSVVIGSSSNIPGGRNFTGFIQQLMAMRLLWARLAARCPNDPAGLLTAAALPVPHAEAARRLLIVWHSRTGMAEQMAQALHSGAKNAALEMEASSDLVVAMLRAKEVQVPQLLCADGFLFCAPENLATMSGEMKEFFDRSYYGALGRLNGRPYGCALAAGSDGYGAAAQLERICRGWRLKAVAEPLVLRNGAQSPEAVAAAKTLSDAQRMQCLELGGLVAAHLLLQT